MSGKLLVMCHCECNEVERRNRKDSGITSLRYRYVPFSSLRDATRSLLPRSGTGSALGGT
nr:hypothetical protein [Nostoc sp. CreGUA01]